MIIFVYLVLINKMQLIINEHSEQIIIQIDFKKMPKSSIINRIPSQNWSENQIKYKYPKTLVSLQ